MTPPLWAVDAVDGVVWAATFSVLWFVVQYTLSSPWWRDPVGRTVVAKDIALLFLLVPICVLLVWPHAFNAIGDIVIDLTSLSLVTVSMAWRCVVWWKIRPPRPLSFPFNNRRTSADRLRWKLGNRRRSAD